MKQADKLGKRNQIGAWGEEIAAGAIIRRGMTILETNYLKKWGEIDIVAREKDILHFVEVKTVSYETKPRLQWAISHETWRPEDNVHRAKLLRLSRTIATWIAEHRYTGNWQIDVAVVRLVEIEKYATVNFIWNVIMD